MVRPWYLVRTPAGNLEWLSAKAYAVFYFRGGALPTMLADGEGYLGLVDVVVETGDDRRVKRVIQTTFVRERLAPDGTCHQQHRADAVGLLPSLVSGVLMSTERSDNLIYAEGRFAQRQMASRFRWAPSTDEIRQVRALVGRRVGRPVGLGKVMTAAGQFDDV